MHGLLQTDNYARAVLRPARPEGLDGPTEARMKRQAILTRTCPPRLWMVLDQAALRRAVGGVEVMRARLRRLLEYRETPRLVIQVLPNRPTRTQD